MPYSGAGMAKERNKTVDFTVYIVIRLAAAFLRALPFPTAIRFAGVLAWILMKISPRRQQIARNNLHMAFPGQYTPGELDGVVAAMYRHFCMVVVEIIHLDLLFTLTNWRRHFEFGTPEQYERFSDAVLGDRPLMIVTGHFGNWELAGYVFGLIGFSGSAIARPLDNPHLDRWMRRWRESTGQKMIAKNGEFQLIEATLRSGRVLQTLGDQDAGQRGLFVPFFHQPASTHKAVALLAMKHKSLIMVMGCARIGGGFNYRCTVEDIIDPLAYRKHADASRAITARFTEGLERLIRQYPEQYLWIHRRWKHQPKVPKRNSAAVAA